MPKKTCLLLLPAHTKALQQEIFQILKSLGIKPLAAKDVFGTKYPLIPSLRETIKESDFVIADVTGTNPNIMFEIGMCFAYEKPVLILARTGIKVPFDLRNSFIVEYDQTPKGLKKMKMDLKERLSLLSLPEQVPFKDVFMSSRSFLRNLRVRLKEPEYATRVAREILELSIDPKIETSVKFESLVSELFKNEGFMVVSAEEKLNDWPVDLILQVPNKPEFLLVECKNREVVPEDITRFSLLLDTRHLNKGIIISNGQITTNAQNAISQELKQRGIVIIAFDRKDFQKVAQGKRLAKLINNKITTAELSARLE